MFIFTIPAVMYVDKLGRKPVLVSGALVMAFCHFVIAIIFAKNQNQWPTHKAAGWGAVAMVWVFVAGFGYSWGPCAWIVVAEVWPLSNRPYGIALGASSNWANNFAVGQATPDMLTSMTYGTYSERVPKKRFLRFGTNDVFPVFFGLLTTMGAAFIYFLVPETKGLSLEEMDIIFGSVGTAQADAERMREINKEVGLDQIVHGDQPSSHYNNYDEKAGVEHKSGSQSE